jgi:hypothetical protein
MSNNRKTDLVKENLNGKVKTVIELEYEVTLEAGTINKLFLSNKCTNKYNENGNLIEQLCENENISIGGISMGMSYFNFKLTLKYDENDDLVEEIYIRDYDGDNNSNTSTKYKHDEYGNKTALTTSLINDSMLYKMIYKYDENGNEIEKSRYKPDGQLNSKTILKYDTFGNPIECYFLQENGKYTIEKHAFNYDSSGKRIESQIYNSEDNLIFKEKYDNNGNLTEYVYYKIDGSVLDKYNYVYQEYDDKGNWTYKIWIKNDKPINIIERVIEYYD